MSDPEYYIDSNVFIRLFVPSDATIFSECSALIHLVQKGRIVASTSSLVLAEVQWVLKSFYKFPKERVIKALKSMGSFTSFADSPSAAVAISSYETFGVKFVDALIASHPKIQEGTVTVISYDKDFDKLGVKRIEPKALLRSVRK